MEDDLYQELIIEHAKHPKNRGELGAQSKQVSLNNPLCGDEITIFVSVTGGKIQDIKFSGQGCMISQAAASMLSDRVIGQPVESVEAVKQLFQALIQGREMPEQAESELGDLSALKGIQKYPVRFRCALLPFEALEKALKL